MTKAEAKKWCLKKFQYIIKNNGEINFEKLEEEYPIFLTFYVECAYCELYYHKKNDGKNDSAEYCYGCPLRKLGTNYDTKDIGCMQEGHPYYNWYNDETKENAEKVYQAIKDN